MNEGLAAQIAKYLVPQIPRFVKEAIAYKNQMMKRYMKKMQVGRKQLRKGPKHNEYRQPPKNVEKEIRIRIDKEGIHQ